MKNRLNHVRQIVLCSLLLLAAVNSASAAPSSDEERRLTELRNTVINLLQALVEKGVLTREQADAMVRNAQTKAEAEVNAKAAQEKAQQEAEKGAVRVPYVPEVVKEEIRKEVVAELGPSVKKEVVDEVSSKGSLRSALPDWVQRMTWTGDARIREERDLFDRNNAQGFYLDFNQVNAKGGIDKAGFAGLLNTTEDRDRLRLRLRFGFDADLGAGFTTGMRIATGAGEVYITTNQSLGTYGQRYQIALDQGYVRWTGKTSTERNVFTMTGGRFANPYIATDLVWYNDLTFEGIVSDYRFNLVSDKNHRHDLFATVGAFPLSSTSVLDPNFSAQNKWLAGAQVGTDLNFSGGSRIRFGAAYYDYIHNVGEVNDPDSTLLNFTAPPLFQKGNTVFNIARSTADPNAGFYALASDFRIVDLTAIADFQVLPGYSLGVTAEALRNIGFKWQDVMARVGQYVEPRNRGYRADVSFGSSHFGPFGTWRAAVGYRYVERDAVVDAFNDQDFHLGGTDAKGYTITLDYSINPRVWFRTKYLSANAIDGAPLAIDVWQLDVNTQF